jgi:hypothetical protein
MLTIDLTPAEEAQLAEAARQRGVAPAEFARQLLREHLPPYQKQNGAHAVGPPQNVTVQERDPELVARVKSIRGKFAHQGEELATELLHRERQADKQKEEEMIRRYLP